MSLLFESIHIKAGLPQRLEYHQDRVNRSRQEVFGIRDEMNIASHINVPGTFCKGHVKCRMIYGKDIFDIQYETYFEKQPARIKLIESDIRYPLKFVDRTAFQTMRDTHPGFDDIIFTRNGYLTDSTYCNLLFLRQGIWYTPATPLLPGTQRAYLLQSGRIKAMPIHVGEVNQFEAVMLINAMLDFNPSRALSINILSY